MKRGGRLPPKRQPRQQSKWHGWPAAPAEPQEPDRDELLRQAQDEARERFGWHCIVPTCPDNGMELHHAYPRSTRPGWRPRWANLVPLCGYHHRLAQRIRSWLRVGLEDWADAWMAYDDGRRPEPEAEELLGILRRRWETATGRHVSPIGPTD